VRYGRTCPAPAGQHLDHGLEDRLNSRVHGMLAEAAFLIEFYGHGYRLGEVIEPLRQVVQESSNALP
jgi:hypothetical protein